MQAQIEEERRLREEQARQLDEERWRREKVEATQKSMADKFEELTRFLSTAGGFTLPPGLLAPIAPPPFPTQQVMGLSVSIIANRSVSGFPHM